MSAPLKSRTFKSGNSVALRLPKALGIDAGTEMTVREEAGRYIVEPVEAPRRKFAIDKVWGSATDLRLIDSDDRGFEERPRWSPGDADNEGR
ncbi:MAG: AbrB/MazE/SpoVT family DNA-binding domain-containing protein [Verrucomicrobiaceae bacterium]|nr:MAG: AbrB/MazE/SpoVT family DNA-binding domain-containing protein [Verrucomicrobiaceae bacterium]